MYKLLPYFAPVAAKFDELKKDFGKLPDSAKPLTKFFLAIFCFGVKIYLLPFLGKALKLVLFLALIKSIKFWPTVKSPTSPKSFKDSLNFFPSADICAPVGLGKLNTSLDLPLSRLAFAVTTLLVCVLVSNMFLAPRLAICSATPLSNPFIICDSEALGT